MYCPICGYKLEQVEWNGNTYLACHMCGALLEKEDDHYRLKYSFDGNRRLREFLDIIRQSW